MAKSVKSDFKAGAEYLNIYWQSADHLEDLRRNFPVSLFRSQRLSELGKRNYGYGNAASNDTLIALFVLQNLLSPTTLG